MTAPGSDLAEPLERFRRWLRDHRLPVTLPRERVATAVLSAEGHPSADGIARVLKGRGLAVGTATLYRTLELLVESGLVRAHDFGEGLRRYEPTFGRPDHGHFVCRRCGAVTEFTAERLDRVLPLVADEAGFRLERHDVTLRGICRGCRERSAEALRS
jgi:Fur family ferric uptake transcriptional regulator